MPVNQPLQRSEIRPHCTQPACLLKCADLKPERLASYLVGLLAGEPPGNIVPGSECIRPRPHCTDCALNALLGRGARHTAREWRRLDELGQWHHRRAQRRARWHG